MQPLRRLRELQLMELSILLGRSFAIVLEEKADAASKVSGNEEEQAQRVAMIAKMSAIAKMEKSFITLMLVAILI
jgi:hypothetical protein